MKFSDLSEEVGSKLVPVAWPTEQEVRSLIETSSTDRVAALQLIKLYRFLPSPVNDVQTSIINILMEGFLKLRDHLSD